MHRIGKTLALWLALTGLPGAAQAVCVSGVKPLAETRLTEASVPAAAVTGWTETIPFLKDKSRQPGCPGEGAVCEEPVSIAPGQVVVENGFPVGDYACVTYVDPGGAVTTAWLPLLHLAVIARSVPEADEWAGDWIAGERSIKIALTTSGDLSLKGFATWGGGDPSRAASGGVHVGEFEAKLEPAGAVLSFTMGPNGALPFDKGEADDCRVQLMRRGPYLVAQDNRMCGGMNVTFTGMYRRR